MQVTRPRVSPRRLLVVCACCLLALFGAHAYHHTFYYSHFLPSTQMSAFHVPDYFWLDWVAGDYFQPKHEVVSPLPKLHILPGRVCRVSTFLVVLVISPAKDFSTRKLIRNTWGRAVKDNRWPNAWVSVYVEVYFVLGLSLNYNSSSLKNLKSNLSAEAELYDDIIVGDFIDAYNNLTLKTLTGLNWARQHCSHTDFVMKVDQDTLVDFPRLADYLLQHRLELRKAIIGKFYFNAKPMNSGKWRIVPSQYPLSLYPTYAGGPCYIISTDIVDGLVNVSQYMPLFVMEDVHVTGNLARALGVRRLYLKQLQDWDSDSKCALLVDRYRVSVTSLSNDDLWKVWAILKAGKCDS
ncbi:hypothetical protein ACOMHN_020757 [Nucella lapillus]